MTKETYEIAKDIENSLKDIEINLIKIEVLMVKYKDDNELIHFLNVTHSHFFNQISKLNSQFNVL
jgi:hypothetical protein